MPLRPEDLPRDVDKLVELAVRLSTENEHLREHFRRVSLVESERVRKIVAASPRKYSQSRLRAIQCERDLLQRAVSAAADHRSDAL